jgi:hypothetical protein
MPTVFLMALALVSPPGARECESPPPRTSDFYWDFIDACGCAKLDPPSRASSDYERYMKACGQWRERNPPGVVVDPNARAADSSQTAPECGNPPSRTSDFYWGYIDACGCANLDPPSSASSDYARFLKACGQWRQNTPQVAVPAPSPSAKVKPTPTPSSTESPKPRPRS